MVEQPPSGYYDYYPTIALERPVVLGGIPSSPYREVGHSLGALAGLPLVDLDHWIEHHAGMSLREALRQKSEPVLRQVATELITKAMVSRPCSLLILGAAAPLVDTVLQQVQKCAALVWLHGPPTAMYWALRQEQQEKGPQPFPFVPFPLEHFEQLNPLLQTLRLYQQQADLCHEVFEVRETVNQLFAALADLGGAVVDEFCYV